MKGEKDQSTETEKRNGQWRAEEGYAKSVGKNGNLSLRSYFHRRFVRRVFSFDALREHHGLYSLYACMIQIYFQLEPVVGPAI